MAINTTTRTMEVTAVDVETMHAMSLDDYRAYLRGGLLFLDSHFVLRSGPAEYPLACTEPQITALLEYLTEQSAKIGYGSTH